jgi:flagellin
VELTDVGGSGTFTNITKTYGTDTKATLNGATVAADGLNASVSTSFFAGDVVFSAGTTGNLAVTVTSGGGMVFQLGDKGAPNEQEYMGIKSMHSTYLGDSVNGFLTTIRTGGANDLFTNPEQAILVIDSAINRVSSLRAQMGAFQKNTLMTNINSLNVSIENITNSESRIRDANIAQETTEFVKNQILTQTGTTVLAQANSAAQNVLSLLK